MLEFKIEWPENVTIFLDNLCVYHVCFDLLSFFMVLFTWWFCNSRGTIESNPGDLREQIEVHGPEPVTESAESSGEKDAEVRRIDWYKDDRLVSSIKMMRQKAMMMELQATLTKDELEEERRMQKMQLEKIFQLLQDQEEKFQVSTMEQLQEQLHLYSL